MILIPLPEKNESIHIDEFFELITVLYAENELQGLSENETEYPFGMWLNDLWQYIYEHKEDIKV